MNAESEYSTLFDRLTAEGMTKQEAIYHIAVEYSDLNAARNEAYTRRIHAKRAQLEDPIKRERAEAERLVALVRTRYSTPGLQAHYTGDTKPAGDDVVFVLGVGWFGTPEYIIPWDVQVVRDLTTCIGRIDSAETAAYAVTAAKPLIALLREAQAACGEVPEPLTLSQLNPSQKSIVLVMFRAGSLSPMDHVKRGQIGEKLDLHPDTIRDMLKVLRDMRLVETTGKRAGLRYYLSPQGATLGSYLDNEG